MAKKKKKTAKRSMGERDNKLQSFQPDKGLVSGTASSLSHHLRHQGLELRGRLSL